MIDISRFEATLDLERDILLSGKFDKLSDIISEKEQMIDAAQGQTDPIPEYLVRKLNHNQSLLQASMEGIGDVRQKLKDFRHVRDCLSFYGPQGTKHNHALDGARNLFKRS
ncbi:hypothetical protein N9A67_03545 [Rhodobacteraceae bacterium]|nr:hypothetical protein [Paracoccaceae bacterium]